MPYATISDLVSRFGEDELVQLTDRSTPPSRTIDAVVAVAALHSAAAEADTYLAVRYGTPVSPVPAMLTDAVCALARERLCVSGVPELVKEAAARARSWMKDLAQGRAAIEATGPSTASGDAVYVAGLPPLFSAAGTTDF